MGLMMVSRRDDAPMILVSPEKQVNAGLWTLFAGTTVLLGLRLWSKVTRKSMWWDDWILIVCWIILAATNSLISVEMATGYVSPAWDARMLILISCSSIGTTINQTLTKTAFAVTLLRMTNQWQRISLWFIIGSLNVYMIGKVFVAWAKYCDQPEFQDDWRMDGFCIDYTFYTRFKTGGNVYNIIMDFVLALFPWMVVWKLNIGRWDKVGLCVTMSLGMVVAIVSAVRTWWMGSGINTFDDHYHWRQGLSMVWYSSEVTGTIMVQCIPLIRPLFREIRTSLTSKQLADSEQRSSSHGLSKRSKSSARRSGRGSKLFMFDHGSSKDANQLPPIHDNEHDIYQYHDKSDRGKSPATASTDRGDHIALDDLGLPGLQSRFRDSMTPSELEKIIAASHTAPLLSTSGSGSGPASASASRPAPTAGTENWPFTGGGGGGIKWQDDDKRENTPTKVPRGNRIDPYQSRR